MRATTAASIPIGPAPSTTTVPGSASGLRRNAWMQVASGSASTASSGSSPSSTRWTQRTGTATSSPKPPGRVPPTSSRSWQTFSSPERQLRQTPHGTCGFTATRRPTRPSLPAAASTTSPTSSCPMISGGARRGLRVATPWTSLPQIPARSTLTSTSPARGAGSSTSRTSSVRSSV